MNCPPTYLELRTVAHEHGWSTRTRTDLESPDGHPMLRLDLIGPGQTITHLWDHDGQRWQHLGPADPRVTRRVIDPSDRPKPKRSTRVEMAERLDTLERAIEDGLDLEAAAARAGWAELRAAQRACERNDRRETARLIRRTRSRQAYAERKAA